MYLLPDDSVRFYTLDNGAICINCGKPIDKSRELCAEDRRDSQRCLCKHCWGGINSGSIDLPTLCEGKPIYRLVNSPILGNK